MGDGRVRIPVLTQTPVETTTRAPASVRRRMTTQLQAAEFIVPPGKRWENMSVEMHYVTSAVAGDRWCLYKHYGVGFTGPATYPAVCVGFSAPIPASSDMTALFGDYGGFDMPTIPTNTMVSYRQIITSAETGDIIQLNFMLPDAGDTFIAWFQYDEVDV